jgi:hypothetical protein
MWLLGTIVGRGKSAAQAVEFWIAVGTPKKTAVSRDMVPADGTVAAC